MARRIKRRRLKPTSQHDKGHKRGQAKSLTTPIDFNPFAPVPVLPSPFCQRIAFNPFVPIPSRRCGHQLARLVLIRTKNGRLAQ